MYNTDETNCDNNDIIHYYRSIEPHGLPVISFLALVHNQIRGLLLRDIVLTIKTVENIRGNIRDVHPFVVICNLKDSLNFQIKSIMVFT